MPESVESIGGDTSQNCPILKSIVVPDNVEMIDYRAFQGIKFRVAGSKSLLNELIHMHPEIKQS